MNTFKDKTVYQIYLKSFMDTNGDGLGDLKGVTKRLDYLHLLGVDYLWLTPFFVSPQNDNGYDVADYRHIDGRYGTMEDLEELIAEADKRDIKIMLDMVFNHTSTEHIWFKRAMAGEEKYKNYYIFRKGKENGLPPTNWESKFGGNAWQYVEAFDEYYLHLFDVTQADLNWDNPEVRQELVDIVNFWAAKGIKGFRFDVINLISKGEFKDDDVWDGRRFYTDGPHVHEYLKELHEKSFGKAEFCMTVGEMSSTDIKNCVRYSGADEHELTSVFSFHHLKVDYKDQQKWVLKEFDFQELKNIFFSWQIGMQEADAWNALFWCNHDQPRAISRFGNDTQYHKESGKMLAGTLHMMRGTPYIYQGEEIGMTNAYFTNLKQYRDVESLNYFNILKQQGIDEAEIYHILQERSRDNSRTPMQWSDEKNAGFTTGTPWLEVIQNYTTVNVSASLADEASIFHYYQRLIQLRKQYKVIAEGSFEPLFETHPQVFAYKRIMDNDELIVISNFYAEECVVRLPFEPTDFSILLSNYSDSLICEDLKLRPYESIIMLRKHC